MKIAFFWHKMIDSKLLINDLEACIERLSHKGISADEIESVHKKILQKNQWLKEIEALRSKRNQFSKEIGASMAHKNQTKADSLKKKVGEIKEKLKEQEDKLETLSNEIRFRLLCLPNFPHNKAPRSKNNVEILSVGYNPKDYKGRKFLPHWEIAEKFELLDQSRASKISGSLFAVLKGPGAKLLRSLVDLAYKTYQEDYTEFIVPSFVNSETFQGTGHLPKFAEDAYHIEKDDLWAIPTGEVPLTAMHRNEILPENNLPLKYMTYTSCFRREAGAAGKETRGMKRLHEFHKVELVKICLAKNSEEELESLLQDALKPLKLLKLPYRILDLCTSDLTFASSRTYDIEVYSPGTSQWLEVSSVGLFTDYQMRRSQIRVRTSKKVLEFPHTLNGSGLATPRVWAAILEHYYDGKNSIKIPEVLQEFMGCKNITIAKH